MNFLENITFRNRNRTKSDSNTLKNESQNDTLNETINSLPDMSSEEIDDSQQNIIAKLMEQIKELKLELNSAHQEIEILSLENNNIKQINEELQKKNSLYKKIAYSPAKKSKTNTPVKKCETKTKYTQTDTLQTSEEMREPQKKETIALPVTQNIISSRPITSGHNKDICKICIISTNKRNNISNIAENTLHKHSENIFHYLLPNCNTEQLISNLENKLATFTMSDFCIIMIGEQDFYTTQDYFQLIHSIRTTVQKVKNTNIIICAPTYKYAYYKNMYNWRVENFVNLLYLDITTHEHAYFLDSNKNLDYEMFNKRTGLLNNFGMRTIFKDIDDFIYGIQKYDLQPLTSDNIKEQISINGKGDNLFFL